MIPHFSNRDFYSFLKGTSAAHVLQTVSKLVIYGALEFLSLILFSVVLWYRMWVSILHLLAFVLEKHSASVHAILFLWIFYLLQTLLIQSGESLVLVKDEAAALTLLGLVEQDPTTVFALRGSKRNPRAVDPVA